MLVSISEMMESTAATIFSSLAGRRVAVVGTHGPSHTPTGGNHMVWYQETMKAIGSKPQHSDQNILSISREQHCSINLSHYEENEEYHLVAKWSLKVQTHLVERKYNSAAYPGMQRLTLFFHWKRTACRLSVGTWHGTHWPERNPFHVALFSIPQIHILCLFTLSLRWKLTSLLNTSS